MVLHRSGRAAGGLVTVAAVTAGLAASLGAGYTVAQATLQDSSAYVTKGTAISHVNGESRTVDATSTGPGLASNGDRVVTRTTPSGEVIAINQRTGAVTTIDRGTMSPTSTVTPKKPVVKAPDVVTSGNRSWLVDYDARAVRPMRNGIAVGGIDIDGRPVDAAPGPDGSLLVLTREGTLFRVGTDDKVTTIDVDDAERAALTVAGGRTYLVSATGGVVDVHADGARRVTTVSGVGPGPDGRMLVGSIQGSGTHVLIVSEAVLAVVDPETGRSGDLVALGTGAHALGEPVEYRGRVYVPDYDVHKLVVVDLATKTVQKKQIDVPGTQRYFDLFVSGDKLWANDQYAQRLVQLDGTTEHQIDKGTGNGTKPDPKPNSDPPPNLPPRNDVPPATGGSGTGRNGSGSTGSTGNGPTDSGNGGGTGTAKPEYVTVPRFPDGTTVEDACNRLIELRLRCNQVPREEVGREDGEVISTRPDLPAKVAVGDSVTVVFVGPTQVPTIAAGTTPIDACADAITEAGLKCAYAPAPEPADDPSLYGTVAGTSPAAGTSVSNGQTVSIQYYDSFVMPDVNGKPGPQTCSELSALSLTLPDAAGRPQPATHPACTSVEGDPAAKGSEGTANNVYRQQPAAGSTYRGGGQPITLTIHSAEVALKDYTLRRGNYGNDAEQAVTECSQTFDCSLSDQTRPAVDNGAHADWVNKVAAMLDADGNDIEPGKKYQIGSTRIRIVKYTDQAPVPTIGPGTSADDGCRQIEQAGFTCNRNPNQPNPQSNVVLGQNPQGGNLRIGDQVTINYNGTQTVGVTLYQSGALYLVRTADQPAPPGYATVGSLGTAYLAGQGNGNWQMKEFVAANCGNRNPNVLYSHGAPDGCMGTGTGESRAGLVVPDGDTCNWGSVWIYRVTKKLADGTVNYGIVRSSSTQRLPSPNESPDEANWPDYAEPLGCIFPP